MQLTNLAKLRNAWERLEDTLDTDVPYAGGDPRTLVYVGKGEIDAIFGALASEVGVALSDPYTDDQWNEVYDRLSEDNELYMAAWWLIDGGEPHSMDWSSWDDLGQAIRKEEKAL